MIKATKLTALLSGIPIGALIIWSDNLPHIESETFALQRLYFTIAIIIYFFVSMLVFVLGTTSLSDRLKYPTSVLFSDTRKYVNYHLSIFKRDLIHLLLYFTGALFGGLVVGT